ncbi:MAG TPA: amidohydrolase family protein [Gemmatimonadaceae bacterium]
MNRYYLAVPALATAIAIAARPHAPAEDVALTNVTLIDGTGAAPQRNRTIVIKSGKISEIFETGKKSPGDVKVIDLNGRYVIPGLIDAHVHVATDPTGRDANAIDQLRSAFRGGVTSVRDMAGDAIALHDIAEEGNRDDTSLPRVVYSAVFAGPEFFKDPRTKSSAHGGTPGKVAWMRAITDTTDLPRAVADAKATGARAIKVYADLPPALVRSIAAEAHKQGMKVWGHAAIYPARPSDAVNGGVDVVSHSLMLYWEAAATMPPAYHNRPSSSAYDSLTGTSPEIKALFQNMLKRGTILDATLFVSSRMEGVPAGTAGMADPRRAVASAYELTAAAREAGIPIAAGTDGMVGGSLADLPNIHREMQLMVEKSHFTPMQAITAATLTSARAAGLDGTVGSVVAGKTADLVILSADPTADISNTGKIEYVVKAGHIYSPGDIH